MAEMGQVTGQVVAPPAWAKGFSYGGIHIGILRDKQASGFENPEYLLDGFFEIRDMLKHVGHVNQIKIIRWIGCLDQGFCLNRKSLLYGPGCHVMVWLAPIGLPECVFLKVGKKISKGTAHIQKTAILGYEMFQGRIPGFTQIVFPDGIRQAGLGVTDIIVLIKISKQVVRTGPGRGVDHGAVGALNHLEEVGVRRLEIRGTDHGPVICSSADRAGDLFKIQIKVCRVSHYLIV